MGGGYRRPTGRIVLRQAVSFREHGYRNAVTNQIVQGKQ